MGLYLWGELMQLLQISEEKTYEMEMCVVCADCVHSSVDNTSIIAEFTMEQFGVFSHMLFQNFHITIFAHIIDFEV